MDFVSDRAAKESFENRLTAFPADLTTDAWIDNLAGEKCNIATLIFVLSAIHPDKFIVTLKNIGNVLQQDGLILFRDYAINDHAMIRFKPGSKVTFFTF